MRTDANGCVSDDCGEVEYVTSIEEIEYFNKEVKIYLNPATSILNISLLDVASQYSIQIYNVQGEIVKVVEPNEITTEIDVSNFSSGLYFMRVESNEGRIAYSRFIKK